LTRDATHTRHAGAHLHMLSMLAQIIANVLDMHRGRCCFSPLGGQGTKGSPYQPLLSSPPPKNYRRCHYGRQPCPCSLALFAIISIFLGAHRSNSLLGRPAKDTSSRSHALSLDTSGDNSIMDLIPSYKYPSWRIVRMKSRISVQVPKRKKWQGQGRVWHRWKHALSKTGLRVWCSTSLLGVDSLEI